MKFFNSKCDQTLSGAVKSVVALSHLCAGLWATFSVMAQTVPISVIEEDSRRALVVEVLVRNDDTAESIQTYVTMAPPAASIGDPPQILVEYFDANGALLGSRFAWDPLWSFVQDMDGGERLEKLSEELGVFAVPMRGDLAQVRVSRTSDDETVPDIPLASVEVGAVVAAFCEDNASDPNCVGFNQPPVADSGGPYEVALGETIVLDASGSTDPDGDGLSIRWDLDEDGVYGESGAAAFNGDEIGETPTFQTLALAVPVVVNVSVEVCDLAPACDIDATQVDVVLSDADGDDVLDSHDACPNTRIPEGAPTQRLRPNRYALTGDAGHDTFESTHMAKITTAETRGCSCEQIVEAMDLGVGQLRFGCSRSVMTQWIDLVDEF